MTTLTAPQLGAVLYRHDPMGLRALGAPADEYSPEARTIAPRLHDAASVEDVSATMAQEFIAWFGADIAPAHDAFAAPATEVWALMSHA